MGFRKGSDLAAALNDFFKAAYADGRYVVDDDQLEHQRSPADNPDPESRGLFLCFQPVFKPKRKGRFRACTYF